MSNIFNTYSRRQILRVSGLLVGFIASSSFPLVRTLATGRPKTVLRFRFTLEGGGKGFFDFNTATDAITDPGNFGPEFLYLSAVSNFSLSGLNRKIRKQDAGWKVVPGIDAEFLGLPPGTPGVLSGVNFPDGCSTGTVNQCSITVAVLYSGNLAELPELSTDPNSYQLLGVDLFEDDGQLQNRITIIDSKVNLLPDAVDRS